MGKKRYRQSGMRRSYLKRFSAQTLRTHRGDAPSPLMAGHLLTARELFRHSAQTHDVVDEDERQRNILNEFHSRFGIHLAEFYRIYFYDKHPESRQEDDWIYNERTGRWDYASDNYGPFVDHKILNERRIRQLKQEGIELNRVIRIYTNPLLKIFLFFSENHRRWMFFEKDLLHKTMRRSAIYNDREAAYKAYRSNTILYAKRFPISK